MLLRFDPFRELDREWEAMTRGPARTRTMPMDAVRRGNHVVVHLDLPGVQRDDVDVSVERNVLTVTATRHADEAEGDEPIATERRHGSVSRQFFLGDTLDPRRVEADLRDGVLTVRVPVAETAKPRRIEVSTGGPATDDQTAISA